jgi:hypothetical protein
MSPFTRTNGGTAAVAGKSGEGQAIITRPTIL